jgi:hypothetical protein
MTAGGYQLADSQRKSGMILSSAAHGVTTLILVLAATVVIDMACHEKD